MGIGSLPTTGICQRPGCHQPAKKQRVYCGKSCHAADFSRRATGIPKRPNVPRRGVCVVCGAVMVKRFPSELSRHCSQKCVGRTLADQIASQRAERFAAKFGPLSPRERLLMAHAYQLGYARHANRERLGLAGKARKIA